MSEPANFADSPRAKFSIAFDELENAHDRKLAVGRRDVYWKHLKRIPIDDLVASVDLLVRAYTSFPKIPQWAKMAERVRKAREKRNAPVKTGDGVVVRGELPRAPNNGVFCSECNDTGWKEVEHWDATFQRMYRAVVAHCREYGANPRVTAMFNLRPGGKPASAPYFEDEGEKEAASRREEREPSMFE